MRIIASLLTIVSLFASLSLPAAAQRSRLLERDAKRSQRTIALPKKGDVRFDRVESYSEGKGAYLRWVMAAEKDNAGFYVYRMDKSGMQQVSEMLPGAIFKYGDQPVESETYTFFDRAGSLGSTYQIVAIKLSGERIESSAVTAAYVPAIESIAGGDELGSAKLNAYAEPAKTKNALIVDTELSQEIASGVVEADPIKHREVIAKPGVRIAIKNDGIIRVDRSQLESAGFDVNADPSLWQLYMEGVERPIIVGPNADYIEFFGKSLDTVESDIRMYFLVVGDTPGRRIATSVLRKGLTNLAANKYKQSFFMKERLFYINQILNGDAENFWGRLVSAGVTNLPFELSGIDRTPGNRTLTLTVRGYTLGVHNIAVSINGVALAPMSGFNRQSISKEYSIPVDVLIDGQNTITMQNTNGGLALFDNVSIDFPRNYVAAGNKLNFYNENYRRVTVSGFTSPNIRLFDVTNEADPRLMTNVQIAQTGGTWGPVIPSGRGRVFTAIEASVFSGPVSVKPNDPEMLGDPSLGANLVIITPKAYLNEAQTWAAYRMGQGFSTKIVDTEEIFDEFGYGVSSSASVRAFLSYANSNWSTPPSYVLLLGDASVDPRNYQNYGYWNQVPTEMVDTLYEETGSDEALADFNGDGLAEIPIGRIAARNATGITTIFNKTVQWESSLTPNSLDRGALFGFDWPDGYDFEGMSNRIKAGLPASMPVVSVQSNAAGATATVVGAFNEVDAANPANSGVFIANYTGHGNSGAWRSDNFFSKVHVPNLTNSTKPTIVTALTCLNGYFVVPDSTDSFAESLTKAANGGAVAVWASTGLTTPDVQEIMAKRFFAKIGDGSIPRMGDLINDAKSQLPARADVRYSWALFGDPMLKVR